jgi:hypothetical protein
MLRQICLEIPEVLGLTDMCLVLGYVREVRNVLDGDLPFLLMLNLGTNGFTMLLSEHLHIEAGFLPTELPSMAVGTGSTLNAVLLRWP